MEDIKDFEELVDFFEKRAVCVEEYACFIKMTPKFHHLGMDVLKFVKSNILKHFELLVLIGYDGFFIFNVIQKNYHSQCTERPCIFSWPMMISNSMNEFFVAV